MFNFLPRYITICHIRSGLSYVLCLFALCCATNVIGVTLVPWTLEKLVARSEIIIVASVKRIVQAEIGPTSSLEGPAFHAILHVDRYLKGHSEKRLTLTYYPKSKTDFAFVERQQYVLFMMREGREYQTVQGYQGVARIRNGQVEDVAMFNERSSQSLDDFIDRVVSYVHTRKSETR